MTTSISNSLAPVWLSYQNKYLCVLQMIGPNDLTIEDIQKLSLNIDLEGEEYVFSFQKMPAKVFQDTTKIDLDKRCTWVCFRLFEKNDDGSFTKIESTENPNKVKIRLMTLPTSTGRNIVINDSPSLDDDPTRMN